MFSDPKTTIAAIVGLIAYLIGYFGLHLTPEVQSAIVVVTVFIIGIFSKDSTGDDTVE